MKTFTVVNHKAKTLIYGQALSLNSGTEWSVFALK